MANDSIEYEEYEAPKQPPFFSFQGGSWYRIQFVKLVADSEKFKFADKPAKVWEIIENGDTYRLTLTSARLNDALSWAKDRLGGKLEGATVELMAVDGKDETDRTFKTRIPKNAQARIGA